MLDAAGLTVGYAAAKKIVLSDLSLRARAGDFICVLGRNGAGKSTLMRTVAGLQIALSGEVLLDSEDLNALSAQARARKIAVVVTERVQSPGLKVDDVVALGRQPFTGWQGKLGDEDLKMIDYASRLAGVWNYRGRYFDDLSDGEKQRVLIARAIAQSPRIMILDEITAFLDLPGRVEVMSMLRKLARKRGMAVLLSSHDLELSLELADKIWLLNGKGALEQGHAQELIRSGSLGSAFDTAEVRFSTDRQKFELVSGGVERSNGATVQSAP